MSNKISRLPHAQGARVQAPTGKIILSATLMLLVIPHATLKAQDPGHETKPTVVAPALSTPGPAPSSASLSYGYAINPDDVLDIYVYDVPELSHAYTVSPSGTVTVQLLAEPLRAAGLTPDQFAHAMEDAFRQSGRLRRPEIAVSVKQSRTLSVTVDGAVRNPLVVPELGRTRLVDILTQCGGVADDAGAHVTITRGPLALRGLAQEGGSASPTSTLELKKVMDGSDPDSQAVVWPGDRVSVERAGVFYVLGEVKSPGGYTLKSGRDELTVLRALALAGDLTPVAKRNKALIIRKDPKAPLGREEIKLDLPSILAGHSPDPVLQANDIIFVPGSGSRKALRAIEAAPGQALGGAGAAALVVH